MDNALSVVSVIIPAYGFPKYLRNAIQSVLDQTIENWELIIVDDNNPGDENRILTQSVVSEFLVDKRINYLKHPHNKNGAAARNTGIQAAKGEYISFLDSDDYYAPSRLEKCVKILNDKNEFGAVYTGVEIRKGIRTGYLRKPSAGNHLKETLATSFMFGTGSNIFMRAEIVRELNGFDEKFIRHQDYEFMARFFTKYQIAAIPEILVVKNNDNVNLPNPQRMEEVKEQYLDKFKDLVEKQSLDDINYIYHHNYISLAEAYLINRDKENSQRCYDISKKHMPLSIRSRIRRILIKILSLR